MVIDTDCIGSCNIDTFFSFNNQLSVIMINMHVYYICPHRSIKTKQDIIIGPIMEKQGHYENEKKRPACCGESIAWKIFFLSTIDYRIKRIFFRSLVMYNHGQFTHKQIKYNSVTKFFFHLFWKFTFGDPQYAHIHSIDVCRPWITKCTNLVFLHCHW